MFLPVNQDMAKNSSMGKMQILVYISETEAFRANLFIRFSNFMEILQFFAIILDIIIVSNDILYYKL